MQTAKEVQTLDAVEAQVTMQPAGKSEQTLLENAKQYKLERPFNFWFLVVSSILVIILNSVFLSATEFVAEGDLTGAPGFLKTLDQVRKATIAFMVFQLLIIPSIPFYPKMEIPYLVVNICKLIIAGVGIPAAKDTYDSFRVLAELLPDGLVLETDLEKDAETAFIILIVIALFSLVQIIVGGLAISKECRN